MGSRIYTRGGDAGTTSLADGTRVPKDEARVEACGSLDEACSWVGAARARAADELLEGLLVFLGHRLMGCASSLAAPDGLGAPAVDGEDVALLERAIDRLEERTGPIGGFVLPGGCEAAAMLHVARTVLRRAERRLASLAAREPVDPAVRSFVNRGSDLLFAAARYANAAEGRGDVMWERDAPRPAL
jgi:cob(I)alamin adenosyltransferase